MLSGRPSWVAWVSVALSVVAAACSSDDAGGGGGSGGGGSVAGTSTSTGTGPACEPSLASIQATVFQASCAASTCHDAEEPAVGLDLVSDGLEGRLVEQPSATCDALLVVPGAPDVSFLVQKIDGRDPACGSPMPVGAPLDAAAIACVRSWIDGLGPGCETCGTGACVDTAIDPAHCGGCDVVCPIGATCEGAACVCPDGLVACGGSCVDLDADPDHCGACDRACPPVQVCDGGTCSSTCSGELVACDGACVDLATSPAHCGDCANDCGEGGTCAGGECACAGGGDIQTDPANCGACGNVCTPGQDCVEGACTCASSSVSFAADVQPILTASCATIGCHRGAQAKEGLELTAGDAWANLVDVPSEQCGDGRLRVKPGDPSESYVMDKILGVDLCFGTRMPKTSPLPGSDAAVIADWICGGALDD